MIYKKLYRWHCRDTDTVIGVTVTAPVAGAQFVVGENHPIAWTQTGNFTPAAWRALFSTDGDAPDVEIVTWQSEADPGTYDWDPVAIAPESPSETAQVAIELRDAAMEVISGTSGVFEISATDDTPPTVVITEPI